MSFLKFWGKKSKPKDDLDLRKDEAADADAEKRKLRHSLSISRSGRFKQKNRERGRILDRPDLYGAEGEYKEHSGCSETSSSASTTSTNSAMSNSSATQAPQYHNSSSRSQGQGPYRDARHQGNMRAGHYMGT